MLPVSPNRVEFTRRERKRKKEMSDDETTDNACLRCSPFIHDWSKEDSSSELFKFFLYLAIYFYLFTYLFVYVCERDDRDRDEGEDIGMPRQVYGNQRILWNWFCPGIFTWDLRIRLRWSGLSGKHFCWQSHISGPRRFLKGNRLLASLQLKKGTPQV